MLTKIVSEQLVVLETLKNETINPDDILVKVKSLLREAGLEEWSSAEIESFAAHNSTLIMAKPIKVYIPHYLECLLP